MILIAKSPLKFDKSAKKIAGKRSFPLIQTTFQNGIECNHPSQRK